MGRGTYNPAQVTWTNSRMTELCPHCGRETTRANYRVEAVTGKALVICDSCGQVLPPRRKRA